MQLQVVNKIDLRTPEEVQALRERAAADGRTVFFMSALTGEGLEAVVDEMWRMRDALDTHTALVRLRETEEFDEEESDIEVIWVRE